MIQLFESLKKLDKIVKTKSTSERSFIISQFVDLINLERPCTYKDKNGKIKTSGKVTGKQIAIMLSHIKDNFTLHYFLSSCKDSKNRNGSFSKCFYGSLKVK